MKICFKTVCKQQIPSSENRLTPLTQNTYNYSTELTLHINRKDQLHACNFIVRTLVIKIQNTDLLANIFISRSISGKKFPSGISITIVINMKIIFRKNSVMKMIAVETSDYIK